MAVSRATSYRLDPVIKGRLEERAARERTSERHCWNSLSWRRSTPATTRVRRMAAARDDLLAS